MSLITKLFGTFSDKELKRIQPITQKVLDLKPKYEALSDEELQAVTPALKQRLADGETLDDILPDAFAACREASRRVLGMEHFPVQITGGKAPPAAAGQGLLNAVAMAVLNGLNGKAGQIQKGQHLHRVDECVHKNIQEQ